MRHDAQPPDHQPYSRSRPSLRGKEIHRISGMVVSRQDVLQPRQQTLTRLCQLATSLPAIQRPSLITSLNDLVASAVSTLSVSTPGMSTNRARLFLWRGGVEARCATPSDNLSHVQSLVFLGVVLDTASWFREGNSENFEWELQPGWKSRAWDEMVPPVTRSKSGNRRR